MARSTLFGHLALTFGAHPENLATEALHYVLSMSPQARAALVDACSILTGDLPSELVYRTQVLEPDGAIPDLIGFDGTGAARLVVEAKFWAS